MKMYTVQPGNRLTGKHRVFDAGENMPESELCGDVKGSIEDGVIVEKGTAPTPQAAQAPAREKAKEPDPPKSIFEELMAKTPEQIMKIAEEYGVENPDSFDRRDALVKAIMRKGGYDDLVDQIEKLAAAGAKGNPPPTGSGAQKKGGKGKKGGGA